MLTQEHEMLGEFFFQNAHSISVYKPAFICGAKTVTIFPHEKNERTHSDHKRRSQDNESSLIDPSWKRSVRVRMEENPQHRKSEHGNQAASVD
jgi:hypothetical protein